VEGVWCPFHDDKNGSEFVDRTDTGGVFLFCRRCNETFWMLRRWEMHRPLELPAEVVLDEQPRHATFTDASDRTHVNEQLQKIGQSIGRGYAPIPPGTDITFSFPTHLVYLPEGTGKSALAFDLAAGGMKILFACKSLEQVFEKYEWFKDKAKQDVKETSERLEMVDALGGEVTPPRQAPINVQLFLSKGAKALARFGVDAVRQTPRNPFDAGRIDDEASIQAFKAANPNLSEEFIRLSWHFFAPDRLNFGREPYPVTDDAGELDELLSGSEKLKTADIIVTTFAQIRLLRVRNHHLSWDWTVWVDDPDVSDFSDIEPYEPERWGELSEKEQQTAGIVSRQATGQRYYRRDHRQSIGAAVRRHRCVYTTTERVTLRAAKKLLQDRRDIPLKTKDRVYAFREFRAPKSEHGRTYTPFIIPPVVLKSFERKIFEMLWKNCVSVLSTAKQVVFLGYSMPPADLHAQFIIRCGFDNQIQGELTKRGRAGRTGPAKVFIVNPDGSAAQRIAKVVGAHSKCDWISRPAADWLG
jgi:hypothetical protein